MIYLVTSGRGWVKIGTATNIDARLAELQVGCPHRLILLASGPGGTAMEAALHFEFAKYRRRGEWFRLPLIEVRRARAILDGNEEFRRPGSVDRLRRSAIRERREHRERWAGTRSMHGVPKASKVRVTKAAK